MITSINVYDILEAFLLYPLGLLVQAVLQSLFTFLFGPKNKDIKDKDIAVCYHVVWDFKQHFIRGSGLHFFLLKFKELESIQVIEDDDVLLYDLTFQEFHFVRVRPGVDHRDIDLFPFVWTTHSHAVEVITIPRDRVVKYLKRKSHGSSDGGKDGGNITVLHNIGRCGSTLLTSMVHKTKQFHVSSEPFPLLRLGSIMNKRNDTHPLDCEDNLDMVKTTFLLICNKPDQRYFVKITGMFTGNLLHLVHKVLPGVKEMFMYRSLVPCFQSYARGLGVLHLKGVGDQRIKRQPTRYLRIWEKIKATGSYKKYIFAMLCQMHPYYLESQSGRNLTAYSYESLLEHQEKFCKNLLFELGIKEELTFLALTALEKDSQLNSPLSKKITRKAPQVEIPSGTWDWIARIGREEFGIEMEGPQCRLTNVPNSWNDGS